MIFIANSVSSEIIVITSDETEFAINITDESWVKAYVDVTNKTLYFWTLSPNLNSSNRVTTATVTAGSGANAPKQEVTITPVSYTHLRRSVCRP